MEDDLNFKVNEGNHNLLTPASSELGTAQLQLVLLLTCFSEICSVSAELLRLLLAVCSSSFSGRIFTPVQQLAESFLF